MIRARGVHAFWPAAADGDDIIVYKDEARREILATLPMLRQQEVQPDHRPNLSLADYIAPKGSGVPDYLGMFAVTGGIGAEELVKRFEADHDDYSAIMVKALADRLAEAFATYVHARVRDDWGHPDPATIAADDLHHEKHRGIRPAPGYPACPDHSEKFDLFQLLQAQKQGMALTESRRDDPRRERQRLLLLAPAGEVLQRRPHRPGPGRVLRRAARACRSRRSRSGSRRTCPTSARRPA